MRELNLQKMPKCVNVVILVIATNIVTLTIFANLKYEKLTSLSDAVSIIPGYLSTSVQNGASFEPSERVHTLQFLVKKLSFDYYPLKQHL